MFGSHLSIAGGLHNALIAAQTLACDCLQVFTKNQRQWTAPPLTEEAVSLWREHRRSTNMEHVVAHDSYLINLAAPPGPTGEKSIPAFRDELERCEALDISGLVTHPGSHVGAGEEEGIRRIIRALDQIHDELPGYKVLTLLENTAGQGTNLGHDLQHLRSIIAGVREPERLGVCIDTAHALAAGYDLTSADGAKGFLKELDAIIGLDRVMAIHINDSKTPRGSRVDRHEHIGHGHVATEAFAVIVRNRRLYNVPKILETPKATAPDGREWDAINLQTLRDMRKRRPGRSVKSESCAAAPPAR